MDTRRHGSIQLGILFCSLNDPSPLPEAPSPSTKFGLNLYILNALQHGIKSQSKFGWPHRNPSLRQNRCCYLYFSNYDTKAKLNEIAHAFVALAG